jgi:hypothetical protein
MLKIGSNLSLPLEFVTSAQAILAKRRTGKSYCASVEAEELLKAKQQIAVIDPTGAWYGLRSSADGKRPGYPIAVFGGEHGDAPLDSHGGKMLAAAMVERGFSAILDVSLMGVAEAVRFVADFCNELFMKNRTPLHLFIDEADAYAPQQPYGEEMKSLHAVKRLVKQGGIRGLGVTMISQRPQVINKDVLSQIDMVTVLQMKHPLDIKSVTDWIKSEIGAEYAAQVTEALPSLPIGTAFICSASPSIQVAKRVEIRLRETFNSGATPKPGQRKVEPTVLAPIEIAQLGKAILESAEKAKADQPDALRARIRQLEVQAKRPVADTEEVAGLRRTITECNESLLAAGRMLTAYRDKLLKIKELAAFEEIKEGGRYVDVPQPPASRGIAPVVAPAKPRVRPAATGDGQPMPKACRSILTALALHGDGTKAKVAALTGYAVSGGGFNNAISECRTQGWLEGSDPLAITREGMDALGSVGKLPSGEQLLSMWSAKVGKAERLILQFLARHGRGGGFTKEALAEATGYIASGGGFSNALSHLRTLELIAGSNHIRLTTEFAEAINH